MSVQLHNVKHSAFVTDKGSVQVIEIQVIEIRN